MQASPLFTNDLVGFTKIIGLLLTLVLLPLAALVVYFLKRGPDGAINDFKVSLNGLGERVNAVERENAKLGTAVSALQTSISESQRDIMEAIRASSEAQIKAVHSVELQVARLQERNDLGDALVTFSKSIEKLATANTKPEVRG